MLPLTDTNIYDIHILQTVLQWLPSRLPLLQSDLGINTTNTQYIPNPKHRGSIMREWLQWFLLGHRKARLSLPCTFGVPFELTRLTLRGDA